MINRCSKSPSRSGDCLVTMQPPPPACRLIVVCGKLCLWPARNLCFAMTWLFGDMRVAPAQQRCLHLQTVAANAPAGTTSLCPTPSEWTGTALAADVYPGLVRLESAVSSERFSREEKENALVFPITCRGDPDCGMLSLYSCSECSGPITSAGSFYLRTGLVGSKA